MTIPAQRDPSGPDTGSMSLALVRVEAKLDVALAQHAAQLTSHAADIADHEARLRVVEAKPTVSPRALWAALVGAAGLVATLSPLLERLYSIHP